MNYNLALHSEHHRKSCPRETPYFYHDELSNIHCAQYSDCHVLSFHKLSAMVCWWAIMLRYQNRSLYYGEIQDIGRCYSWGYIFYFIDAWSRDTLRHDICYTVHKWEGRSWRTAKYWLVPDHNPIRQNGRAKMARLFTRYRSPVFLLKLAHFYIKPGALYL